MSGSNTFGGTIRLEGEKEYRSAISQINSDLRVFSSELGKLSAEFGKNTTSTQGLTEKNKFLTEQIEKQKEKIVTLKGAVQESAEKYGEHDKKTNNWKTSLNKAETQLLRLENELASNTEQIKKNKDEVEKSQTPLQKLNDTYTQQQKKLAELKEKYSNIILEQGKNSTEARELAAEIKNLNDEIRENKTKLQEVEKTTNSLCHAEEQLKTPLEKLNSELLEQQKRLESLQTEYKNVVLEQGKNSTEARELASEIKTLNGEIKENKDKLDKAETATKKLGGTMEETDKQTSSLSKGFTVMKGVISNLITDAIKKFSRELVDLVKNIVSVGIEYESSFTNVKKTVNGTDEQLKKLNENIRNMAKSMPQSSAAIAEVASAAGQLGIATDDIASFTETMIKLGDSTNLSSEEAATSLARFATVTKMSAEDYNKLGSAIVALGNNFATTESEIVALSTRLASAGTQIGMTQADILGFAASLSSVGIEAEAGGTAFSKLLVNMQVAATTGVHANEVIKKTKMSLRDLQLLASESGKDFKALASELGLTGTELKDLMSASQDLQNFSEVVGTTGDEFAKAFQKDATEAVKSFIAGLNKVNEKGGSAITVLENMGISEVRLRDTILRAVNANDLFTDALNLSSNAWSENTALTNEANQRYATTESKLGILKNNFIDFGLTLYDGVQKPLQNALSKLTDFFKKASQSASFKKSIDKITESMGKLIEELGDMVVKFLPTLLKLVSWLIENSKKIVVSLGAITTAMIAIKAVKFGNEITNIIGLAKDFGVAIMGAVKNLNLMRMEEITLEAAQKAVAAAQWLINSAMNANPYVLVLSAIAALTAGIIVWVNTSNNAVKSMQKQAEAAKDETKEILANKEAWDESTKARQDAVAKGLSEMDYYQSLYYELINLTDANGKVIEGYEGRASFISGQLSETLNTEITMTNGVIENYNELKVSFDELIKKKEL